MPENCTEQTLLCGPSANIVATITLPAGMTDARTTPTALLTNSGVISRAGPHRINVQIARRLAAQGIASIRFDLSGVGDSRRSASTLPQMEQWVLDTRAVMDLCVDRLGSDRFFMVGFCSGAEVAYRCALVDERLVGILLWDLYAYPTWRSRLNTLLYKVRRAGPGGIARKFARTLHAWAGKASAAAAEKRQLQDLEPPRVPSIEEFAQGLATLAGRGASVLVMFCGGEPHWYNYEAQFKDSMRRFPATAPVRCVQLPGSDHLLTQAPCRTDFIASLQRWLLDAGLSSPVGASRARQACG